MAVEPVSAIANAVGSIAQSEVWKNVGAKRRVDAERLQESERTRQLLLQNRLARTQAQTAQQPTPTLPARQNNTALGVGIGIGVLLLLVILYLILKK